MGGDTQLKNHVEEELRWQPEVNEAAIGVRVQDAIVTLTGNVPSYAEKMAAERAVMRIHGVRALASELQVSLSGAHERTDEDIARAAANVLAWNALIPKDTVKVKVSDGFVTLSGVVEWSYERRNAERDISQLIGVKAVLNSIEVKPPRVPGSAEIKSGIEAALRRSAEVEAKRVHVEIHGSTVVLTGAVSSWPERQAAERAVWSAPGVSKSRTSSGLPPRWRQPDKFRRDLSRTAGWQLSPCGQI
jgi:osmotically-inducible protein OsmY